MNVEWSNISGTVFKGTIVKYEGEGEFVVLDDNGSIHIVEDIHLFGMTVDEIEQLGSHVDN